jgi:hypothetical protein
MDLKCVSSQWRRMKESPMTTARRLACFFVFAMFVFDTAAAASADYVVGTPFNVKGERLDVIPPPDWKIVWMEGDPNGEYFVEYVPPGEDLETWKAGHLSVIRKPYPSAQTMKEIRDAKLKVADVALIGMVKRLSADCATYQEITMRTTMANGLYLALAGGYCGKPSENAPFGEGAFVAFYESKNFIYKVQYSWRPQSEAEKQSSLWAIDAAHAKLYRESIKSATLCDESKNTCKARYRP